jgi:hypothetical protein
MTSAAQIEANRRNARHSTGPRTEAGKAASSRNALRHGLRSDQLILFDETVEGFETFHAELCDSFAPGDAAESILVERIAVCHWRLRRVWRAEAAAFNLETCERLRGRVRQHMVRDLAEELEKHPPEGKPIAPDQARQLARAGVEALGEEQIDEAVREEYGDTTLAEIDIWPRRLLDLSRHETMIERQLHRLLLDLDRVQQRRRQRIADADAKRLVEREGEERKRREAAKRSQILDGHPMADFIRATHPDFAEERTLSPEGEGEIRRTNPNPADDSRGENPLPPG